MAKVQSKAGRKAAKADPKAKAARSASNVRAAAKAPAKPKPGEAPAQKPTSEAAKAPRAKPAPEPAPDPRLGAVEEALIAQLAVRMHLTPTEVLARALHAWAAAVAPDMKVPAVNDRPQSAEGRPAQKLMLAVDGKTALEIDRDGFVIGSGEGCDLRLNLPLISPRHARLLWREGRHLFEDLQSSKGSYLHGQRLDVRFLEDGDEIDLGGFLPLRFRLV